MTEPRNLDLPFEEALLSGYLDGALTQQDMQRVRIGLERSVVARRLLEELRIMREASMGTSFHTPDDRQWDEIGRTATSRGARGLGLAVVLVWTVATLGYAFWEASREMDGWLGRTLLFGGVGGLGLVFLSVLIDRFRDSRSDRYRGVQR